MNRKKTHLIVLYFSFIISGDWRKIQKKYGKTAAEKTRKKIACSRAMAYIPKTGDFRLQTVMLPIGRFWKLLRKRTSRTRESKSKLNQNLIMRTLFIKSVRVFVKRKPPAMRVDKKEAEAMDRKNLL